jgi:hypothetical protein
VNLVALRERHSKLAERASSRFGLSKIKNELVEEFRGLRQQFGERDFRSYVSLGIAQELLKRLCRGEEYKTALGINASLIRTDNLLFALREGLVGKKEVDALFGDAVKITGGFGDRAGAKRMSEAFERMFKNKNPVFKPTQAEAQIIQIMAQTVTAGNSQMLYNLLGEKKIAVLEMLMDKLFTDIVREIR